MCFLHEFFEDPSYVNLDFGNKGSETASAVLLCVRCHVKHICSFATYLWKFKIRVGEIIYTHTNIEFLFLTDLCLSQLKTSCSSGFICSVSFLAFLLLLPPPTPSSLFCLASQPDLMNLCQVLVLKKQLLKKK